MVAMSRSISRHRGSEANPHLADPPAMAVPETLRHPFATAKIVRSGTRIVDRRCGACGNDTPRAYRFCGEQAGDRCDQDEGGKCLLHSRALQQTTPSVGARWMRGKLLVAQSTHAAIDLQVLSFDEAGYAKLVEKNECRRCCGFRRGLLCRSDRWDRSLCADSARPRDRRTAHVMRRCTPLAS